MALTKTRLKKELMEKSFEEAEGGSGKKDPRILPYYDLKVDEKMEIILIPNPEGNLFSHYKKHGPNLKTPAAGSIGCRHHQERETCPICIHGFETMDADKELGKKFMPKDYYVYQCVVVNAPMEILPQTDGNEARIFYAPWGVHEKIKEAWAEGLVEDPTEHVFVIKKTAGKGGNDNASYSNSYFRQEKIPENIIEAFGEAVIEPYDLNVAYGDIDPIIPASPSEEEAEEWLGKAISALDRKMSADATKGTKTGGSDLKSQVSSRLNRTAQQSDDDDDNTPVVQEKKEDDAPPVRTMSKMEEMRAKLKRSKEQQ